MKYLCCLLIISFSLKAQLHVVAETSITLPSGIYEDLYVFPVEENTLLVNFQDDYIAREKRVVVLFYNENLQLLWSGAENIPRFYEPVGQMVSGRYLYHLSREKDSKKLHLLAFHLDRMEVSSYDFETLTAMDGIGFTVFQQKPLIYGRFNNRPVIEMHELKEKTVKVLSDVFLKNNELKGIYFNPVREEIFVFYTPDMKCALKFSAYDMEGRLLYRKDLGEKKKKIQDFRMEVGPDGVPYLLGTYNAYCAAMVEGVFFMNLDLPAEAVFRSLLSMPFYVESLPARQSKRLQSRKEQGKGKETRQKGFFQTFPSFPSGILSGVDFYLSTSGPSVKNLEGRLELPLSTYRINHLLLADWTLEGEVIYGEARKLESEEFSVAEARSAYVMHQEEFVPFLPTKRGLSYVVNDQIEQYLPFQNDDPWILKDIQVLSQDLKHVLVHGLADRKHGDFDQSQIYFLKKLSF